MASLEAQDYQGGVEVLVADGGSTDGTLELLASWSERLPRLRIFDSEDRLQSHGLNLLAELVNAEILVRVDAHSTYAPDYVSKSIEALTRTGATAVGGPMRPQGTSPFGRAVARSYRSKLGIGPAPFHHSEETVETDTVYLGAINRQAFLDAGGMRTLPSQVAEDADFYYRLRKQGGKVMVDPAIKSTYQPRETPGELWRQFFRYGLGKADMFYVNGEFPSWRPLAPLALIVGLAGGLVALAIGYRWPVVIVAGTWVMALLIAAKVRPLDLIAIAIMHLSYGLGLLRGLLRSPTRVRAAIKGGT